jgi:hypothetical protein
MASDVTKPFKLIWTSQNKEVDIECGEYASSAEARADILPAQARLLAKYPGERDLHDIKAGTWRVVPAPESDDSALVLM